MPTCLQVKSVSCTTFCFVDEELPSVYYKELLFDLHSHSKEMVEGKSVIGVKEDDSSVQLLKMKNELTVTQSKLKLFDKVLYLLIGVVAMLSFVIVVLVI